MISIMFDHSIVKISISKVKITVLKNLLIFGKKYGDKIGRELLTVTKQSRWPGLIAIQGGVFREECLGWAPGRHWGRWLPVTHRKALGWRVRGALCANRGLHRNVHYIASLAKFSDSIGIRTVISFCVVIKCLLIQRHLVTALQFGDTIMYGGPGGEGGGVTGTQNKKPPPTTTTKQERINS